MVLSVFAGAVGTASAASPTTDVSVTPSSQDVDVGSTTTYDIVVDSANGGVNLYNVSLATNNSNAKIVDVQNNLSLDLDLRSNKSIGPNNESAKLDYTITDSSSTGQVTVATVTVEGNSAGAANLGVTVHELSNESGQSYSVSAINNATVNVTGAPTGPRQTELSLTPSSKNVSSGSAATFDIEVANASGGIGNYNVSVAANNSNVEITSVSNQIAQGLLGFLKSKATIGPNNGSAMLHYAGGDTSDTGTVTLATVTVSGTANGTTQLDLSYDTLANEDGIAYTVTAVNDATVTVPQSQAPAVVGSKRVRDLDGDGKYEDLNGDQAFNINDIITFLSNYNSNSKIQNNAALFNFNGDTDAQGNPIVDLNDVIALLGQV